jgi:hypothetical protein
MKKELTGLRRILEARQSKKPQRPGRPISRHLDPQRKDETHNLNTDADPDETV